MKLQWLFQPSVLQSALGPAYLLSTSASLPLALSFRSCKRWDRSNFGIDLHVHPAWTQRICVVETILTIIGLILYKLVNAWPELIDVYWMLLHKKKQNDLEQTTTLRKSTNITQNHQHKQNRSRALQISIPHTFKQKKQRIDIIPG